MTSLSALSQRAPAGAGTGRTGHRSAPPHGLPDAEELRVVILSDAGRGRNGVGVYYDDLSEQLRGRLGAVVLEAPPGDLDTAFEGLRFRMPGDPTQALHLPKMRPVWRRLKAFRPHVIVAATPWVFGIMGLPLARATGAALCVGYHTQFDRIADLYWNGLVTRFARPLFHFWDRVLFRFADRVLVHNRELIDSARDGGAREVTLMGTPAASRFLAQPAHATPDRIDSLVFVGRLAPEKRVDQVVEAARSHPSLAVHVIGDGPLDALVRDAAANLPNLTAHGWVDRARVLELLDRAHALVLPSRFETFGTAAYEAMLRRRAVIVSPGCGLIHWPELRPGVFVMNEGEEVAGAVGRLRAAPDLGSVAEVGWAAARELNERTLDHWVSVLVDTVHARAGR